MEEPLPQITLTVRHPMGLHARPAALFVQKASSFTSDIRLRHGEREANAKSILGVLTLGVGQDAVIAVEAEGADAQQALEALRALVEGNFGEAA